jgi:hypothetical protein
VPGPTSDQDDRASLRPRAGTEQLERASPGDREGSDQTIAREPNNTSVVTRVGKQQQDGVDGAVTTLQGQPPFQRLNVPHPRLCLNTDSPSGPADNRIPRPEVPAADDRNLDVPPEARINKSTQPLKELEVSRVANRIARWIGPNADVSPERREEQGRFCDRQIAFLASCDPPNLPSGHPNRRPKRLQGQAVLSARDVDLAAEVSDRCAGSRGSNVNGSGSTRHRRSMNGAASPPVAELGRGLGPTLGPDRRPGTRQPGTAAGSSRRRRMPR